MRGFFPAIAAMCLLAASADAAPTMSDSTMLIKKDPALIAPEAPPPPPGLVCESTETIRMFKDHVYARLTTVKKTGTRWARCVCGEAADRIPLSKPPPPEPDAVPAFPAFDHRQVAKSRERARRWYYKHLPISTKQSHTLATCYVEQMLGKRNLKPDKKKRRKKRKRKKKIRRKRLKKLKSMTE